MPMPPARPNAHQWFRIRGGMGTAARLFARCGDPRWSCAGPCGGRWMKARCGRRARSRYAPNGNRPAVSIREERPARGRGALRT